MENATSFIWTEELKAKVKQAAEIQGKRSQSSLMREAVEQYCDRIIGGTQNE